MTEDDYMLLLYIAAMLFCAFMFRKDWLEDRELKRFIDRAQTDKAREDAIHVYRRGLEHRNLMMSFTFIGAIVISVVFYWHFVA